MELPKKIGAWRALTGFIESTIQAGRMLHQCKLPVWTKRQVRLLVPIKANNTLYHTYPWFPMRTSQLHILHFAICECLVHKKPTDLKSTQQILACSQKGNRQFLTYSHCFCLTSINDISCHKYSCSSQK